MNKKRGRNKILSLLLSLALIITMIPYGVFAEAVETTAESENRTVSYSWINPAYEGVLGEEELISGGAAAALYSSDIEYVTTPEEAAEIVRECLVNRAGSFTLNYKYPAANASAST